MGATTSQDEARSREDVRAGDGKLGLGRSRVCAVALGTDSAFIGSGPSTAGLPILRTHTKN